MALRHALSSLLVALGAASAMGSAGCEAARPTDAPEEDTAEAIAVGTRERVAMTTDELQRWMTSVYDRGAAANDMTVIECAEVAELAGVHACAGPMAYAVNLAFARATMYAEGGFGSERESVSSHERASQAGALHGYGGHDLKSESLQAFWRDAKTSCAKKGRAYCPSAAEKAVFEGYLLPAIAAGRLSVLIAFGATSADVMASHELLHAQYFVTPALRSTVQTFWKEQLTGEDKRAVREALASTYDVRDEGLVQNELFAYLLQRDAEHGVLRDQVSEHAPRLRAALATAGIEPLETKPFAF